MPMGLMYPAEVPRWCQEASGQQILWDAHFGTSPGVRNLRRSAKHRALVKCEAVSAPFTFESTVERLEVHMIPYNFQLEAAE
jgi:hypothetical protein